MSVVESAPRHVESVPTATAPVCLPDLREPMPRAWGIAATVAGGVAVGALVFALAVLS